MRTLLDQARSQFDYVLIDSPPGSAPAFGWRSCGRPGCGGLHQRFLRPPGRPAHVAELGKRLDTIHLVMNRIQPKLMRRLRTTIDDAMDERGSPCWASSPKIPRSSWPPYTSKPLILFSRKGAAIAYLNIAKRIMGSGSLMKIR